MHANATLTPLKRAQMARDLTTRNLSRRAAAAAYQVSDRTVRRWLSRAQESAFPSRLPDRSSIPHCQPRRTSSQLETQIVALRRERRSYAQIIMVLPVSKATLSRVLRRHHLNRLS